ncbi:hypothetical protein L1987_52949 [Smallanthus sonchifolius]|uniref:Uncharacterized protein n=1 Tax=Smallanthus sonchifolius TaxID=185202 RepID=A0ACB9EU10_9ASTR|nr:hypothetical protein L1987_52949 [Smallanthus sonchifolius]
MGVSDTPKRISALNDDEKKLYDREKKSVTALPMCLPLDIYHTFKKFKTTRELWEGLAKRCEGSTVIKKNIKELLKKQFMIKEQSGFDDLSLEDLMGKIQSYDLHKQKKDTVYQDPSIYFGKGTSSSKSGGVALFLGE